MVHTVVCTVIKVKRSRLLCSIIIVCFHVWQVRWVRIFWVPFWIYFRWDRQYRDMTSYCQRIWWALYFLYVLFRWGRRLRSVSVQGIILMHPSLDVSTFLFPCLFTAIYLAFIHLFSYFQIPFPLSFNNTFHFFSSSFLFISLTCRNSGDKVESPSRFALPADGGVGAPQASVTTTESASVLTKVLRFDALDWTKADYEWKHADQFDVRRSSAFLSDGLNLIMYDRRRMKRDTSIGGWDRFWNLTRPFRLGIRWSCFFSAFMVDPPRWR